MNVDVNVWAVILGAVSSMVIGTAWYSKSVFGVSWMKMTKLKEDKMKDYAPRALGLAFLSSLLMAYILAHMVFLSHIYFKNSFMTDALSTAFWAWLGFQALRVVMRDAFEQRRLKLSLINAGNDFVTLMVMGLIIGLFK